MTDLKKNSEMSILNFWKFRHRVTLVLKTTTREEECICVFEENHSFRQIFLNKNFFRYHSFRHQFLAALGFGCLIFFVHTNTYEVIIKPAANHRKKNTEGRKTKN